MNNETKENINNSTIIELIEMFLKVLKSEPLINYNEIRKIKLEKTNKLYSRISISNWNAIEKEILYLNLLKGINIYYFIISNKRSIPIGGFNSVMNAINGSDFVYINLKSIKWFPLIIKKKIKAQGIIFEDFEYTENRKYVDDNYSGNWLVEAADSTDIETLNTVYWNLD